MPRRLAVTGRRMEALLRLPSDRTELLKHYTLSDEDLGHVGKRRRPHNKFGFALQLCALRYPGRLLAPGELIPAEITAFIGAQLGLHADALIAYFDKVTLLATFSVTLVLAATNIGMHMTAEAAPHARSPP